MSKMEKFQHVIANLSREEVKQVISTVIQHNAVSVDDLKQTLKEVNQRIMKETTIDLSDGEETPEVTPKKPEVTPKNPKLEVLLHPGELDDIVSDWCGDNESLRDSIRFVYYYGFDELPNDIKAIKMNEHEFPEKRITYSGVTRLGFLFGEQNEKPGSVHYVRRHMETIGGFPFELRRLCEEYIKQNAMSFEEFRKIASKKGTKQATEKSRTPSKKRKHEQPKENDTRPLKQPKKTSNNVEFKQLFDAMVDADTWRFKNRGSVFEDRTEAYKTAMEECKDFCKETDGNKLACLKYMLNRHTGRPCTGVH